MEDDLGAHLVALELRLQDPATRGNADAMSDLLSEGFREFGASGRVWDRAEIIGALRNDVAHEIVSDGFECRVLSTELALITYASTTADRKALRSSLWRREGDRWRILFHQGTVIPNE